MKKFSYLCLSILSLWIPAAYAQKSEEYNRYQQALQDAGNTCNQWKLYSTQPDSVKKLFFATSTQLKQPEEFKNLKDTIIAGDRYILCIAWKQQGYVDFYKGIKSSYAQQQHQHKSLPPLTTGSQLLKDHPVFVTIEAEMREWCKQSGISTLSPYAQKKRLREVLGLPPNSPNNHFVEIWVKAGDIFRPALDSALKVSEQHAFSPTYYQSFTDYIAGSYSSASILNQYPFWGTGITYDYGAASKTHFGFNEFTIRENRTYYVRKISRTRAGLQRLTDSQ